MSYFEISCIFLAVTAAVAAAYCSLFFKRRSARAKMAAEQKAFCIFQSEIYGYIGFAGVSLSTLLSCLAAMRALFSSAAEGRESLAICLGLLIFEVVCVILGLFSLNWKIEFGDESFTFTNVFGKKWTFRYDADNILFWMKQKEVKCYTNDKCLFTLAYKQKNSDALYLAHSRYFNEHQREEFFNNDEENGDIV